MASKVGTALMPALLSYTSPDAPPELLDAAAAEESATHKHASTAGEEGAVSAMRRDADAIS